MEGYGEEVFVDLHVHTTASDGTDSPSVVVDRARQLGLAGLAITDHDTVGGVAEGVRAGSRLGVEVIPGVEISCLWRGRRVHLLGYYLEVEDRGLTGLLEWMRRGRETRLDRMLERLGQLGMAIRREEVEAEAGGETLGRPHLARVMVKRGFVSSVEEAFSRYLASGRPAYADRPRPPIKRGIRVILEAGGVPVLAHPLIIDAPLEELLGELRGMGLEGVEYYYPYEYEVGRPPSWYASIEGRLEQLRRLAGMHDLVMTGGSDYHGASSGKAELGCCRVPYSALQALHARHMELHGR